jgi:hypothetical protein
LAIKIPRLTSWKSFLTGLLCNIQERQFAKTGWAELCPVYFADPWGFIVVMPRCMPLHRDYWLKFNFQEFVNKPNYCIPVECKYDSFGKYKDKTVAVDYGS